MSDTPRTDAATHDDWSGGVCAVNVEVCAKLERELNEANAQLRSLKLELKESYELKDSLVKEHLELCETLKEALKRERVAIASWDEERHRALREAKRVLEVKADADALADAIEYTLKADALLHPETKHVGMRQALETYRNKYKEGKQ